MQTNGEDAHKVTGVESGATFSQVAWAPDGKRVAYLKHYSLESKNVIESCDLKGQDVRLIWSDPRLENFCWTSRGRIIAALTDRGGEGTPRHSDLWEMRLGRGDAPGAPRRLTNFPGFAALSLSATADGKSLALVRNYDQSDVYVGDLEAKSTHLSPPQRLTLDDRIDWPGGWMRDDKTVLFYSDRQGSLDIFRQNIDERTAHLVVGSSEEKRQPQLTPDGSAIIYLDWPKPPAGGSPSLGRVMRVPISGGSPQVVLPLRGYPGPCQVTETGYPDLRCSRTAGGPCVLAEGDSKHVTFYRFDPMTGGKTAIATVDVDGESFWDLSADGSKIAWAQVGQSDRVRILPAGGGNASAVPVKSLYAISSVGWTTDGEGLFLTGRAPEGGFVIRHLRMDGQGQLLYKTYARLERPLPSPDGKHLAFGLVTSSNNVWITENFEE